MLYESARVTLTTEYQIATLTLVGGSETCLLCRATLNDLADALAVVRRNPALDVLVIRGDRPGAFGDGPDPAEFTSHPIEAAAVAALGQRVAATIASLDQITVAEIHGPCLGGALELALACDVRLAVGDATARIGFCQVPDGIIPCWGGTVRLPKLVGLRRTIDLFTSGRKLSAAQARRIGLVQYAFPPSTARAQCDRLIIDLQADGRKPRQRQPLLDRFPGRRQRILRLAWKRLRSTISPDHKSPRELFRVLYAAIIGGDAEGFIAETAGIARLAPTLVMESSSNGSRIELGKPKHTIANLHIRVDPPAPVRDPASRPFRRVGVIGGGAIGTALAQWAALHGCSVTIQERDESSVREARERLARQFRRAVNRRLIAAEELADRVAAVPVGCDWAGFENADLIIEAVDEDHGVKAHILQEAERHIPAAALMTTCSTSLTVRELQEGLARPQRLIGLHVAHPAAAMRWIEVSAGPVTDPALVKRLRTWLRANGRKPLLVADRPGRALGRVLLPYLHEAVLLAEEGYDVPSIDAAVRRFGLTWGPFEALDAAGLDVMLATLRTMTATVPGLSPPPLLERLVMAGCRGQKSGTGFYRHNRLANVPNATQLPRPLDDRDLELGVRRAVTRLLSATFTALGSGLVREANALDGLLLGAGWPAFRGGPVRYAERRGLPAVVSACEDLARRFGPRFEPGKELRRRAGEPMPVTLPFRLRAKAA